MKNPLLSFFVVQLLFVLSLLGVDRIGGGILYAAYSKSGALDNYAYRMCDEDVVILGSSRAKHHYVPSIITDSLNMSCYNLGSDGMNIYFQYELLTLILKHHTPDLVISDLFSVDLQKCDFNGDFGALSCSYPLYDVDDDVKDLIDRQGAKYTSRIKLFHLYRYNTRFLDYFLPTNTACNGYVPVWGEWSDPIVPKDESDCVLDPVKMEFIEKLASLCEQHGVPLVFAVSPRYYMNSENVRITEKYKPVDSLCAKDKIPFLYYELDSFFLQSPSLFKDPGHLNNDGAVVYTKRFIGDLKHELVK